MSEVSRCGSVFPKQDTHVPRRAIAPALEVAHADRALALEYEARGVRVRDHGKIRPLHRGMQERARRTHAPPILDRALGVIDAELAFAVVVGVTRNAERDRAFDERLTERMTLVDVRDG